MPEGGSNQRSLTTREELADQVIRKAKWALVPALTHRYESCNEGMTDKCFTCAALGAIDGYEYAFTPAWSAYARSGPNA